EFPHDAELKTHILILLEQLLRTDVGQAGLEMARVFRRTTEQIPEELEPRALALWDDLSSQSVSNLSGVVNNPDRMLVAINHVRGILVEALLEIVAARKPTRGAGLGESVGTRLSRSVSSQEIGATFGRVIIGSRLWFLYLIDPEW